MVSTAMIGSGSSTIAADKSASFTAKDSAESFGKVMSKSLSYNAKTDVNSKTSIQDKKTTSTDNASADKTSADANKTTDQTDKTDDVTEKTTNQTDAAPSKTKQTGSTDANNEAGTDTISSKIESALQNLKEEIKQKLGISEEELEKAMSSLGLTAQDLLKLSNIVTLVAQLTGSQDAGALLTNSDLSSNLKDILQFLNQQLVDLSKQTGISVEDIQKVVPEATVIPTDSTQEKTPDVQATVVTDSNTATAPDNVVKDTSAQATIQQTAVATTSDTKEQAETSVDNLKNAIAEKLTTTESTKSEGKQSNLMNGQEQKSGTEVKAEATVTNIAANLAQNIQETFESALTGGSGSVNAADIVRQVVDAVKVTGNSELQSMEIQLNPENLGKVNLTVTARSGVVTAQIVAENEQVKRALENQMYTLKENLEKQGVKVDAVEVTVQSHSFEGNQNLGGNQSEQGKGNRKNARRNLSAKDLESLNEDELQDNERMARALTANENSSVEYSA